MKSIEDPPQLSFRDINAAVIGQEERLQILVDGVTEACRMRSDPKDAMSRLNELLYPSTFTEEYRAFSNSSDLTLAIACAAALLTTPTVGTWNYLWSLTWHSPNLSHSLPRVVTAIAREYQSFKSKFLEIGSAIIKEAWAQPGRHATKSEREKYSQLRTDWEENPSLTRIWQGLEESFLIFRDDEGVLGILADLDLEAFMRLLSEFDNPYPIFSALYAAQAGWCFNRWKMLLRLAPIAFNDDRNWNGSPIVPLLLVIARDQVLGSQFSAGVYSDDEAINATSVEIESLGKEIAKAIAARSDAGPCSERWATWLMRQTISAVTKDTLPYPVDARSRGYVDAVLINSLGAELQSSVWSPLPCPDSEPWEPWCYRCALVSIAANGDVPMPSVADFLDEWVIRPEDWASERGQSLRERASLFETFGRYQDAYGTRLLATPLVYVHEPQRVWEKMWDTTQAIREIVEFGDPDAPQDAGFRMETAASELMELLFGLGLMMLECLVDPNCKVQCDRQSSLEELLGFLFDAVKEMSTIDRFNRIYWNEAFRHLALRRAVWVGDAQPYAAVFGDQSKPSLVDFVTELSVDAERLFALLEVALRNGVGRQILRQALIESGIDLATQIAFADKLITTDSKRAGIDSNQLSAASSLLDVKSETV